MRDKRKARVNSYALPSCVFLRFLCFLFSSLLFLFLSLPSPFFLSLYSDLTVREFNPSLPPLVPPVLPFPRLAFFPPPPLPLPTFIAGLSSSKRAFILQPSDPLSLFLSRFKCFRHKQRELARKSHSFPGLAIHSSLVSFHSLAKTTPSPRSKPDHGPRSKDLRYFLRISRGIRKPRTTKRSKSNFQRSPMPNALRGVLAFFSAFFFLPPSFYPLIPPSPHTFGHSGLITTL